MNRLAIFCYYSPSGLVPKETIRLLKDLKTVAENIIVIVNGELYSNDFEVVADKIVLRENIGYDAGAYKFFFENEDLKDYLVCADELILCNSSFYGPFISFRDIFERMENVACHFWGLSSSEKNFTRHIQSYFLVFRRRILKDDMLQEYFRKYIEKNFSYHQVCNLFENGLFAFLTERNYVYSAFCRDISCNPYSNPFGSLYIDGLPILKKKIFKEPLFNRQQVIKSLQFISQNFKYDMQLLLDCINQENNLNLSLADLNKKIDLTLKPDNIDNENYIDKTKIEDFIRTNERVYIYGTGYDAMYVFNSLFFSDSNCHFAGFLDDNKDTSTEIRKKFKLYNLDNIADKKIAIINACEYESLCETKKRLHNFENQLIIWKQKKEYEEYTVSINARVSEAYYKYRQNGNFPLVVLGASGKVCGVIGWKELKNTQTDCFVWEVYNQHGKMITECENGSLYAAYSFFANGRIKSVPVLDNKYELKKIIFRGIFSEEQYKNILCFVDNCNSFNHKFVYGAGKYARCVLEVLLACKINIDAFIVSEEASICEIEGIPVKKVDEVNFTDAITFVAMKQEFALQVLPLLNKKKASHICLFDVKGKEVYSLEVQDLTSDFFGSCREIVHKQQQIVFNKEVLYDIIVIIKKQPDDFFKLFLKSIELQSYEKYRLHVVETEFKVSDSPDYIEYINKHNNVQIISNVYNSFSSLINSTQGNYVIIIDWNSLLHPSALYEMTKQICFNDADFVYTDEIQFCGYDISSVKETFFKPDFSPDLLNSCNYIGNFFCFKKSLLNKELLLSDDFATLNNYDIILSVSERSKKILHIPSVLYYRNEYENLGEHFSEKTDSANKKALLAHLKRLDYNASVENNLISGTYKINYELKKKDLVSILIPTCDHSATLKKCVDSIVNKSTYQNYEIILIENNSKEQMTFSYYDELKNNEKIKLVRWKGVFNYSAINNFGFSFAKGKYILLLNNDVEVISPSWLEEMLMFAQRDDVGAVGAKLYYLSGRIQHAGVFLGVTGVGGHSHRFYDKDSSGYNNRLKVVQNLSAVTGACLMLPRKIYEKVHGLTETFAVAFNDVDLCMKIRKLGYNIVWTPYAELFHAESESRGSDALPSTKNRFWSENYYFEELWGDILKKGDPFYNINLTLQREDLSVDNIESKIFHA